MLGIYTSLLFYMRRIKDFRASPGLFVAKSKKKINFTMNYPLQKSCYNISKVKPPNKLTVHCTRAQVSSVAFLIRHLQGNSILIHSSIFLPTVVPSYSPLDLIPSLKNPCCL